MVFIHFKKGGQRIVVPGGKSGGDPGGKSGTAGKHCQRRSEIFAVAFPQKKEEVIHTFPMGGGGLGIEFIGIIIAQKIPQGNGFGITGGQIGCQSFGKGVDAQRDLPRRQGQISGTGRRFGPLGGRTFFVGTAGKTEQFTFGGKFERHGLRHAFQFDSPEMGEVTDKAFFVGTGIKTCDLPRNGKGSGKDFFQ